MADTKEVVVDAVDETGIDYSKMNAEELLKVMGKAWDAKDMKLMGSLSRLHGKAEAAEEKNAKDKLLSELVDKTTAVRKRFKKLADEMKAAGELDGAEGIWFAYDFGEIEEVGINPSTRLIKSSRGKASGSTTTSTSSYVSNPTPSKELLAAVGDNIYFANDEEVTIDKVKHTMAAGTSYQEAYDFSTNGGWRNRVRMALLKEAVAQGHIDKL